MTVELRSSADFGTSASVRTAIAKLSAAGPRSGLFFDFDGVLSSIQPDPETVQPTAGVAAALKALRPKVGKVALVSARNAEFLLDRLGELPELEIYGLYGLERVAGDGVVRLHDDAREWLDEVRVLCAEAARDLPGVYIEDKKLSVGLHYRQAPDLRGAVEDWAARAAERTRFIVQPGRMAVELKPPLGVDKGTTLAGLIDGLRAAWYFGDDLGDLPAFATLHARVAADPDFAGLAVGVGNDTVVDEVLRQADVFLASPEILVEFLDHLAGRL